MPDTSVTAYPTKAATETANQSTTSGSFLTVTAYPTKAATETPAPGEPALGGPEPVTAYPTKAANQFDF